MNEIINNENILYQTMLIDYPDVLNVEDVCKILGIGKKLVYSILKENNLDHPRIGRAYKIPKINLIQYLTHIEK